MLQRTTFRTLNLPNAREIYNMFYNCRSLYEAPNINAPVAQDVYGMFQGCEKLVSAKPLSLPKALSVNSMYQGCKVLEEVPALDAPLATSWRYTYYQLPLARKITTPVGPSATDITYLMWETSAKLTDIGNVLDIPNVTTATNWIWNNDPMHIKGPITIKGCKSNFYLKNCRSITSIRFENMSDLCGNLDFSNCAMEVEALNTLFGDLVNTAIPATINISGNPGAIGCNPSIATEKGWRVITV